MMPDLIWERNRLNIRKEFSTCPEFMPGQPWMLPTLGATMYVGAGPILDYELYEMGHSDVQGVLWGDGDVTNLLHQRYHLWRWERNHPNYRIAGLGSIAEFGAGYGAMSIVASRFGFKGDYYIHDLMELVRIQKDHLPLRGVQCRVRWDKPVRPDLFISCFGLSEAPLEDRDEYLANFYPKTYLLAFQHEWSGIDNREYFLRWAQDQTRRTGTLFRLEEGPKPSPAIYLTSYWGGK